MILWYQKNGICDITKSDLFFDWYHKIEWVISENDFVISINRYDFVI